MQAVAVGQAAAVKIHAQRGNHMKYHNTTNTITAENVQQMANAITIRALTTNYGKSGNETIRHMLYDAINFARNAETAQGGDGAALIQDTAAYLWQYNGQSLDDTTGDGRTDKNGEPITILRGAFYNIRKQIYNHERKQYKQIYVTDYEQEHGEIAVPFMWDIDSHADYITTAEIIAALELTENQKYILSKRLQGYSLQQIADTKGISKQAVANTLAKIGKKYVATFGDISVPALVNATGK